MSEQILQKQSILKDAQQTFNLSLPLIATYLVQSASPFIGTMMVARLGKSALAATGLVGGLYITIIVFMFGLLSAVSVLVAQAYGAKNKEGIRLATSQGFVLGLLIICWVPVLMYNFEKLYSFFCCFL